MKTLSVILPVNNAAGYLQQNVQLLIELLPQITSAFQIIIVDDGSLDGSDDLAAELERCYPQVASVFHAQKLGEAKAIESGMKKACYPLTFVQATGSIQEAKIRRCVSRGLNDRVKSTASQRSTIGSAPAGREHSVEVDRAEEARADEKRQTTTVDRAEQCRKVESDLRLVERLMEWGIALRKYRQHLEVGPEIDGEFQATHVPENHDESTRDTPALDENVRDGLARDGLALAEPALSLTAAQASLDCPLESDAYLTADSVLTEADLVDDDLKRDEKLGKAISPPKFSSIAEKRLSKLCSHDLARYATSH